MSGIRGVTIACVLAVQLLAIGRARADMLAAIDAAADGGDAWNVAIPNVGKLLGAPATATDDRIEWAVMDGDLCFHVVMTASANGFVDNVDSHGWGPGTEGFAACQKLVAKKAKLPADLKGPRQLDVDPPARAVMELWGAGTFDAMLEAAHPSFRKTFNSSRAFAKLAKLFGARAGRFVKLGAPLVHSFKDSSWVVTAPAEYEKGSVTVTLSFQLDGDTPKLTNFDLRLPKALQATPDNKAAARAARAALDLLLAAKTDAFIEHWHWDLVEKLPKADLEPQLREVLKKIGKVRSIKQTEQTTCDGRQCFTFELTSATGTAKATFDMGFAVAEWLVFGFNLAPPETP